MLSTGGTWGISVCQLASYQLLCDQLWIILMKSLFLLLVIITFIISDLECEILVCLFSTEADFFGYL